LLPYSLTVLVIILLGIPVFNLREIHSDTIVLSANFLNVKAVHPEGKLLL
jgi:hypothetical protein